MISEFNNNLFRCKCGKEFPKSQSLYAHQSHCKIHLGDRYTGKNNARFHTIIGKYTCICGKEFGSNSSYKGHLSHCRVYLGEERYLQNKKARENFKIAGVEASKKAHSAESYHKQSETRKKKYASGELFPAKGVGRGKYSYIVFNNTKIMLRSTYEFIFALYLLFNKINFEYESIRVTYGGKTFISDFKIGNRIIEIKGNPNANLDKQREAFEKAGFEYDVKYKEDIDKYCDYLKNIVDIDSILESIEIGHNSKNYFVYIFN